MPRSVFLFRSVWLAACCVALTLPGRLSAQQPNAYSQARVASTVLIPGNDAALSLVSDTLCVESAGLVLWANCSRDEVMALEADVAKSRMAERITYVVRHPVSGHLFYTSVDKRGRVGLYELVPREGKEPKAVRVKVGDHKYGVTHPVFSADGRMMVFSARYPKESSLDIWCAWQTADGWSDPVRVEGGVNTQGDETSPFLYRNYIFFASRGRSETDPLTWRIYAASIEKASAGDVFYMPSVSVVNVHQLPAEVNSGRGDKELVVDSVRNALYWITFRNGNPELCTAQGTPEGFALSGTVADVTGRPLQGVRVEAWHDERCLASRMTDAKGRYGMPLQAEREYQIRFSREGYFTQNLPVAEKHGHKGLLQPLQRDVRLSGWSIDAPLFIDNMFGDNADVVLIAEAEQQLRLVVRFLADNPQLQATMSLHCARTGDSYVNSRLNERRLDVLRRFFSDNAPSMKVFFRSEGDYSRDDEADSRLYDWLEVTFQKK